MSAGRARRAARAALAAAAALAVAAACTPPAGSPAGPPRSPTVAPASPAEGTDVPRAAPPSPTPPATTPARRSFSLVATGDVLLHDRLWRQAEMDGADGAMDFGPQLAGVRHLVAEADLAVCHLEVPLAPAEGPFAGYPSFSGPPQIVPALAATGFDACTTASNHTFDAGAAGVDRTLDALDASGIAHAGSARTPEEASAPTVLEVATEAGPVRLGLLAYTYGFNGVPYPGGQRWRADRIDADRILAEARTARRRGAEVVVVALHWGTEYVHEPDARQLELAPRLLASPDVDLMVGHHAHVVQPLEWVDGEWVAYGLGNLVAAHRTPGEPLSEGLLVRFDLAEDRDGRFAVTRAAYAPLLVTEPYPVRVLDVARALRQGRFGETSEQRLRLAWERTTDVVGRRGAVDAGLVPLSSP